MNSLRFRLIIIFFLAIIPMAGLIIYNNWEQRQLATLTSQKELLGVVKNCVSDYTHTIQQTRQLLAALAAFPAVIQQEANSCSELFARIVKEDSLYLNIMATRQDGEIFATAKPLPPRGPHNLTDRLYFKRILQTKQFSLGELVIGRATGMATLPCAYPILDHSGQFQGVVAAGLNLSRLNRIFQITDFPGDACFGIIDNRGRIMYQHPEPDKWIGKDLSHAEIIQVILAQKQGLVEARGIDGKKRLYSFLPLGGATQEGFVFYGIPTQIIYAPLRQALIRNLSSLGGVTVFALVLSWLLGYLFVIRRMNILTKATKQVAAGDLSARTGMNYGKGEIDLLACAFDEMAGTLRKREIERRQSEEDLRKSEEKYRLLVNQIPAVVYKGYRDWSLDCFDCKIEEITGYSQEDFNSRRVTWRDLIFPEDVEQAKELFLEARKTNNFYVTEYRIKNKIGQVCWIQARNQIVVDATGKTDYTFSRKQILQPRMIDLNTIVTDMDKMLRRLIGEDIELATHKSEQLGLVKADPGQIEQTLMNLAVNARDAMPHGGKLTIETGNVYLDEEYTQNHAGVRPGFYVMIAVTDNGVGMDAEKLSHIFEPFFTTKESGKGTGLGLAMVYGIVKQSGGHIWVYSEPGHGTAFKMYFPRIEDSIDPVTPLSATRLPAKMLKGGETILLVEDDAVLRKLISRVLNKFGYKVWVAGNGGEALSICEKEKGPIHLMLTDVVMPQMSGTELAERVAALRPGIEVVYMSGYTTNAIVHHGVLDAGINFIQKPVKIFTLIQKVREVLDNITPS
ncbi:MAG: response regulator [Deltaproteobacteria bacterium]|nr:response regulator [Deltaproteobacteria bacterium]